MIRGLASIVIIHLCLLALGQEHTFTRFTVEDGLPSNRINCFLKDQQEFMWIGTSKGLCKYDGHTFKHYTRKEGFPISDDWINVLYQDSDGLIWIGTNIGGVNVYDPVKDSVTHLLHEKDNPKTIPGNRVSSIAEDCDGNIWVGFNNNIGLSKIDKETWDITNYDPFQSTTYNGTKAIHEIITSCTSPDIIWLATTTAGLIAFNTKTDQFRLINHPTGRYSLFSAYQLNETQIIGGFWDMGTDVYNIKEDRWSGITSTDNPLKIFGIAPKSDHELWLAARKNGLAVIDLRTNSVNLIPSNFRDFRTPFPGFTNAVYVDGKSLWVGSVNGISFYDSEQIGFPFDSLSFSKKQYGRITDAIGKYDKIYLTGVMGQGLWEIDKLTGQKRIIELSNSENLAFSSLLEQEDKIILNDSEHRIIVIDKVTGNVTKIDLTDKIIGTYAIRALASWKDQKIIMSTWHAGVQVLDLNTFEVRPLFKLEDHIPAFHHAMVASDGTIWCSSDKDVVIYHPDEDYVEHYSPISMPNQKNKRILSIAESSDGTKWIGSLNGLIKLSEGKETLINSFNSNLTSDYIRKIEIDRQGKLWLWTDEGMSKLDPTTMDVANYGAAEGIRPAGAFRFIDDKLLVGQYGGYSFFHPDSISSTTSKLNIYFTDFQVFNESFALEKHINHVDHIDLKYFQNFIKFEFTAPALSRSQQVYFSYQLEGLDEVWVNARQGRVAKYTNLDGGHYTFKVRARNKDGEWTTPRSISIHIATPFWETWWFYSLCGLITISVGFIFYKTRISIIQRKADLEAQELRADALQKRLTDLNALPPDLDLNFEVLNSKLTTPLSEREFEVLLSSLNGKSNSEIAEKLFISQSTVKFHLRNTYSKLGVSNRKEALVYVVKES